MVLIGRYSQRECQIISLVFQNKSYSVLSRWCHMFQQQGIICNSCRPMRIQNYQKILLSFLQWLRLILVSRTIIFQQVFFLGFLSGFLRLMDILAIFFCKIPGINMVNLYILFLNDLVKWYSGSHFGCPRQK